MDEMTFRSLYGHFGSLDGQLAGMRDQGVGKVNINPGYRGITSRRY